MMMNARDATGRQVSLLNDGPSDRNPTSQTGLKAQRPLPQRPLSYHSSHVLPRPSPASRSNSSSPNMPELLRSDSYDSQTSSSNDPLSPMTPSGTYAFGRSSLYPINQDYAMDVAAPAAKRPAYSDGRTASFAEDDLAIPAPLPERSGKRYPCRYRDSHGCEKTFTTSGHASRHSKIHTAEKAVQCTYPGCQKKFTRADNMKQHLETHYKDKSRAANGQRAHKAALAGARRNSVSGRSRSIARESNSQVTSPWEKEQQHLQYPLPTPPVSSNGGTWDMRGLNLPLLNRPLPSRTPSSGLDALAMAIAAQEGEDAK